MTDFGEMEFLIPGVTAFTKMQKPKVPMPEHISDTEMIDGDMTIGEYELARRFPLEYDLRVNGIRHIVVRDLDKEYRYKYEGGKLIMPEVF